MDTMNEILRNDYVGKCEVCGRELFASGIRRTYGDTAITAHGPTSGEKHTYCAPCWHWAPPTNRIEQATAGN